MKQQTQERVRDTLNRHYDYPSQRLAFKSCLDDFTKLLISTEKEARAAAFREAIGWANKIQAVKLNAARDASSHDEHATMRLSYEADGAQRVAETLEAAANSVPEDSEGEGVEGDVA